MLQVIDPTTGTLLREVPTDTTEAVEAKLALAATAAAAWRDRRFAERAELLQRVAAALRQDREAAALVMTEEMGKPIREARAEVDKGIWCAEHYASHAEEYLQSDEIASDASYSGVRYLPLGVVLGIMPWNAPCWLSFRFCAPALMAGNSCLIKHDPHTPGSMQAIERAFAAAKAPAGLLQGLYLDNAATESVIRDRRVQGLSFTGSTRGGAAVAAIAASEVKPQVLELGGSDPAIVLADADLAKAAQTIALSRIINAGQSCIAAKRLLVEDTVHDRFIDLLQARLAALKVGDPRREDTDVGPLARADLRDNLHRQVEATIAAGAHCRLGGTLPEGPGFFYPVTLLTEVEATMPAFCEETFGPVAVCTRVRDADHAVQLANDTPYGLAASIWSKRQRGLELAGRIDAGQVVINGIVKTDPRLPSGGIKRSGYGRELGPHGIKEFVNAQQIWVGD